MRWWMQLTRMAIVLRERLTNLLKHWWPLALQTRHGSIAVSETIDDGMMVSASMMQGLLRAHFRDQSVPIQGPVSSRESGTNILTKVDTLFFSLRSGSREPQSAAVDVTQWRVAQQESSTSRWILSIVLYGSTTVSRTTNGTWPEQHFQATEPLGVDSSNVLILELVLPHRPRRQGDKVSFATVVVKEYPHSVRICTIQAKDCVRQSANLLDWKCVRRTITKSITSPSCIRSAQGQQPKLPHLWRAKRTSRTRSASRFLRVPKQRLKFLFNIANNLPVYNGGDQKKDLCANTLLLTLSPTGSRRLFFLTRAKPKTHIVGQRDRTQHHQTCMTQQIPRSGAKKTESQRHQKQVLLEVRHLCVMASTVHVRCLCHHK